MSTLADAAERCPMKYGWGSAQCIKPAGHDGPHEQDVWRRSLSVQGSDQLDDVGKALGSFAGKTVSGAKAVDGTGPCLVLLEFSDGSRVELDANMLRMTELRGQDFDAVEWRRT